MAPHDLNGFTRDLAVKLRSARDGVAAAKRQVGGSLRLVGYDVNGIQEYITANSRPIAMRGASSLISDFDLQQGDAGALFAGGGRGLFLVPEERAKWLLSELPNAFARATVTGVLAVAAVPWGSDEKATLQWLKLALQRAKDEARAPDDELPGAKQQQCSRCRMHAATENHAFKGERETERVCRRCDVITERGRKGLEKDDQHGLSLASLSAGTYFAAISADGNNMGRLFDALDTLEATAAMSAAVAWLFEFAHKAAIAETGVSDRGYIAPISGGDDIRVFIAPEHVERYVRTLARTIEEGSNRFGNLDGALRGDAIELAREIGVGVGVAVAGNTTSASWMLQRAHDLERAAKTRCLEGHRSAVDYVWVTTGEAYLDGASSRRELTRDRRPIPLDGKAWESLVKHTRAFAEVPASQRSVVARQTSTSREEFANLFRYQVARSPKWQTWYADIGSDWRDSARVIADMPDAAMLDLLRILGGSR